MSKLLLRCGKSFSRVLQDAELFTASVLLSAVLVIGLSTASRYGISIDEFNTDDYGPKALAWFTSGFTDRSHFETVEFSLWYYGPWFHILTSVVQSLGLGDRFAVRHAMTFLVGWGGIAALLPLGRLVAGKWAGLAAVVLSFGTGYLYGSLFFTTIDVPFLAAMTWATLAIVVATRRTVPSWGATVAAGLAIGLAIGTRTGGIVALGYLALALLLAAGDFRARHGTLPRGLLIALAVRFMAAFAIAAAFAVAIWPWLQIGNPFSQFMIAFRHFGAMPMSYEFAHWGERLHTDALPLAYVPGQLAARLPEAFLVLLAVALLYGIARAVRLGRQAFVASADPAHRLWALPLSQRTRALLIVLAAAGVPIAAVMILRTTIYDGIRHLLFVIPMLAIIGGTAFAAVLPVLLRTGVLFPALLGAAAAAMVFNLVALHPLEYVAMNAFAGGTSGAYRRFEQDYASVASAEAVRQLQHDLHFEQNRAELGADQIRVMICIPSREWAVAPLLPAGFVAETDIGVADYVIETERWRCAANRQLRLIDEVRRADRPFAWIYARADDTAWQAQR